jgi:hypothetical protein
MTSLNPCSTDSTNGKKQTRSQRQTIQLSAHFGGETFTPTKVFEWIKSDLQTKVGDLTLIPIKVEEARKECFAYHTVVSSAGQDARDRYYGSSRLNGVESPFETE